MARSGSLTRSFDWGGWSAFLYRESVLRTFVGVDDGTVLLQRSPLAMFFYNQRTAVFGVSLLSILALWGAATFTSPNGSAPQTLALFAAGWLVDAAITLLLHRAFLDEVKRWARESTEGEHPALYRRYFFIDVGVVATIIALGASWDLPVGGLPLVLVANTLIYTAYVGGGRDVNLIVTSGIMIVFVTTYVFFPSPTLGQDTPTWFEVAVYLGCIVGCLALTIVSISLISFLRRSQHAITRRQLELLGKYEAMLSRGGQFGQELENDGLEDESLDDFLDRVERVLQHLCGLARPFWYRSACLWLAGSHQDKGPLWLPVRPVDFPEADECRDGMPEDSHLLSVDELVLVPDLSEETSTFITPTFRSDEPVPAAAVPLWQAERKVGVLTLYGAANQEQFFRQEEAFLRSLGAIIADTLEQWQARQRLVPQEEMDQLFGLESLEELYARAVAIMKKHLVAAGCMLIIRDPDDASVLKVEAVDGFLDEAVGEHYPVGIGLTGRSAELGRLERRDDVVLHRSDFDEDLLERVEEWHERAVKSWMAIPIGSPPSNFGVIKVVNSQSMVPWFTSNDEILGRQLADRLHVLIAKFRSFSEARRNLEDAQRAAAQAELEASNRLQDLMTITHQLQGPLISVIGTLSALRQKLFVDGQKVPWRRLYAAEALVEDALFLSNGTSVSLAIEAGRGSASSLETFSVSEELKGLTERLILANSRPDLSFEYEEEPDFPHVTMARQVFLNVMHSLIHNAVKYSDPGHAILVAAGFENGRAAVKVKSLGQPILASERGLVFQKFYRGRSVRSGRRHAGTGLGLWAAMHIITAVGGELRLELDARFPRLSVFVVELPTLEVMSGRREES